MTTEKQGLGELHTVDNKDGEGDEASKLLVGWLLIDGDLKRAAFTEHDLKRPLKRAERNEEDIPPLEPKPAGDEAIDALEAEIKRLKNRGFWARLLNK